MAIPVNRERTASDILLSLEGAHLEVWKLSDGTICVSYYRCEVKCVTTVPYPAFIIRDMKQAGYKIRTEERK